MPLSSLIAALALLSGYAPEVNYVLHCQGCHGADGSGLESGGVPPLSTVGSFLRVPGGREYLIQVPGIAQAPLDDEDLASLLNWLVERFSAEVVAPYDAAEVARARSSPPANIAARREELLGDYPSP